MSVFVILIDSWDGEQFKINVDNVDVYSGYYKCGDTTGYRTRDKSEVNLIFFF